MTDTNGTVFRVEKNRNYTVMSNQHFHCINMSLKAKGLLSLILSLPAEWDYSINGLTAICKESRPTIQTTLNELKELGYLEIIKHAPSKENGGRFTYEYIIYEESIKPKMLKFSRKND